jgi:hypothetical protein
MTNEQQPADQNGRVTENDCPVCNGLGVEFRDGRTFACVTCRKPADQGRGVGELPALPSPKVNGSIYEGSKVCTMGLIGFTADQMQQYARAAIAALTQPKGDADTVTIGATRCYPGDEWFRELTLDGVTFLAPLDQDNEARWLLATKNPRPVPSLPRQSDAAKPIFGWWREDGFVLDEYFGLGDMLTQGYKPLVLQCADCEYNPGLCDTHDAPQPAQADTTPAAHGVDFKERYYDLIYQVGNKYPGESRHDTAKRYLQRAEQTGSDGQAASAPGGPTHEESK